MKHMNIDIHSTFAVAELQQKQTTPVATEDICTEGRLC